MSKAIQRVVDRYGYTYQQCCTMPLNLLIFLHDCARMEEENRIREEKTKNLNF